uniref:DUF1985 domain-containing protein n=1 Tax=Solanum lycopersicum TaxID=4081 RepID=A0A3Q7FLG6_SOLLC
MYFMPKTFIETEDMCKMTLIYFKETFLLSAQPTRNYVSKLHFELVDRGKYKDHPWENICFRTLLKPCIYECCSIVDTLIPQRVSTCVPRILNWHISDQLI